MNAWMVGVEVVGGIYSPQPPKQPLGVAAVDGRTGQSGAPPDTVRCASHVTQPLGFGHSRPLEPLSSSGTGQSGAASDRYCSLSSAPLTAALLCRALFAQCSSISSAFAVDRCAKESLLCWCTRQSGGTPDSPLNYSGATLEKPETAKFDPVRSWCTGQFGAPDQSTLSFFAPFFLNPFFVLLLVCVEPLCTCRIYNLEQTS
jgi:hypothetical protein